MRLTSEVKKHLRKRLFARVRKTDSCWLWEGTKTRGYGMICCAPYRGSTHKLSLLLVGKKVPKGLTIDHLCRVPNCLNPSHLEIVTAKENNLRGNGWSGRNGRKTHCVNGHEFTPENIKKVPEGRQCRICSRIRANKWKKKVGYHSTLWKRGQRFYVDARSAQ